MNLVETIPVRSTLGEGVLWDTETQTLWWTDIEECRLYRYDLSGRRLCHHTMPERLCSFGFTSRSGCFIAAFESGFALYEPEADAIRWLVKPEAECQGMRLNDGRVDRHGRFWAGSMAETEALAGQACLYCVDTSLRLSCRERGISISNSICWSPDSTVFYFADTPRRIIWRYDFDASSGAISNRRVFAETPSGALPDGAVADADGCIWSAQWGAGRIVRYSPDGRIVQMQDVPVRLPTCVAFGGPALDLLFVTSARSGLEKNATGDDDGNVLVYEAGTKGLPEARFELT